MPSRAELVEQEWWSTSYHEAGHAALRVHYRLPIVDVTISVDVPLLGQAAGTGLVQGGGDIELDDVGEDEIAAMVVTSFAGPETETWFRHQHQGISLRQAHTVAYSSTADTDIGNIAQLVEHVGWTRRAVRGFEAEARGLVGDLWESIDAIAEALRDNNGYLTGDQIYNIA